MSEITLRNGFQYTLITRGEDIRRMPGIVIRDVLNNVPNTCSFRVDGNSNVPVAGEKIEIIDEQDGDRLLFAGIVLTVEQIYEDQITQLAWNVTAVDFTWLLNRRRPYGTYTGISAGEIVKDLVARFAPGFTTAFVQSDLARISILFDGSQDFNTCLNRIAEAIGGGHWYVDYNQDVHFFHTVPPDIQLPDFPESIVQLGPVGAGGVGAGGGAINFSVGPNLPEVIWSGQANQYLLFQVSYVYSNGAESALGPASAPVLVDQGKYFNFNNIPIGLPVGDLTVTKRRIWACWAGNWNSNFKQKFLFYEVRDNTTTSLQTAAFNGRVVPNPPPIPPVTPYVAPPVGPSLQVTARESSTLAVWPYNQFTNTQLNYANGYYAFRISNVYADLTESLPGPESDPVLLDGTHKVTLSQIPIAPDLNGVPVLCRRVYAVYKGGPFSVGLASLDHGAGWGWDLVPDNTSTEYDVMPVIGGNVQSNEQLDSPLGPIAPGVNWPNEDGPNLEDTLDSPDDITNENMDLLRDPPFTSQIDLSQVRNRIFVRGVGTRVTASAAAGATQIEVAELRFFSTGGGKVYIAGSVLPYAGVSAPSGPGVLILNQGLPTALGEGDVINLFLQVDSLQSQQALGRVELDKDGNQTDGIHEFTISDTSLQSPFELFMRGMAELELFAFPVTTIRYATRDPNTRSGRKVHVDMTNPPIVGDFLIQDVTIDQIHDESDQLSPRYTVTATSVKFDLNDLLLKILGQNPSAGMGGASGAGSVTEVNGPADTFQSDPFLKRTAWAQHFPSIAGVVAFQSAGMGTPVASGTTPSYDSNELPAYGTTHATPDRRWAGLITSTSNNDLCGFICPDWIFLEDNIDLVFYMKVGQKLTNVCFWAGMSSGSTIPLSPGGTNIAICAIRYSTGSGAGDGAWRGILQPQGVGHSQYRTDPLMTITAGNEYRMRIRSQGGPVYSAISVAFKVDDLTQNSLGSWKTISYDQTLAAGETPDHNMPVANPVGPPPGMRIFAGTQNLGSGAGSERRLYFKRLAFTAD